MNKYNRVKQIGEGAFGKAILVKRKDSSKQCVIKEVNILKMSPKEKEEARKEVAVLAQLKHPNIVSYIESFEEKGSLFIVMNFCSGGDLYGRINERRGILFSEDMILDWFVQLCLAVKHIHDRKILHRDIKCQNIFITNTGHIQLGDFGIAKVLNTTAQLAHTCIGTPYYLSPEIVENMPYNNKSDIWSMGCVLYEVTTLKHAFEAANMKNLVLKIVRGSYTPVPSQFSYDLRGLISQMFKRSPRDRPSVNSILRKNFIMQRVRRLLSAEDLADEFSHTVMHGHKIAKALPPGPKPSADPSKKAAAPRPGSANKRYDPAAVYGASVSRSRLSGEQKKRPSTPNRAAPIPGAADWEKRKKEKMELEQKRRLEIKKREQEMNERRHRDLLDRQKQARINKAREDGWRHLAEPFGADPRDNQVKSPRPLPVPRANVERDRGNYEAYNEFINNLHKHKSPSPVPAGPGRNENPNHIDVINVAARPLPVNPRHQPQPRAVPQPMPQKMPRPNHAPYMGPLGVPVPGALDQAGRDRQKGAQAAQRARVVEDYIERQREANLNKKRAQHDLFGHRPPSAGRRTPVPAPNRGPSPGPRRGGGGGGGGVVVGGRDREEQEYLEKLRQIRFQNMKDRRVIQGRGVSPDEQKVQEAEERKRKAEALKNQAEEWAERKRKELERRRIELFKGHGGAPSPSPSPSPAVPITGALHLIGAGEKAIKPPVLGNGEANAPVQLTNAMQNIGAVATPSPSSEKEEVERPKTAQQKKKESILKKLNNDKGPLRSKWGAPAKPVIAASEASRGKWGAPASPMIMDVNNDGEEAPESSRSQWGERKSLHLTNVPLEQTASQMEATSSMDKVVRISDEGKKEDGDKTNRSQWGRRSDVVKALDKMPVCQDTVTLSDTSDSNASVPNVPSSANPPPGIGFTVTLPGPPKLSGKPTSKGKTAPSSQPRRPLPLPPERSGTVVISRGEIAAPSYNIPSVSSPLPKADAEVFSKIKSVESKAKTLSIGDEEELPSSMRFIEKGENPNSKAIKQDENEDNVFNNERELGILVEVSESQSLSQTQQLKVEKEFVAHVALMKSQESKNSENGLAVKTNLSSGKERANDSGDRDGAKSVQMNLCTGQFDMKNITFLSLRHLQMLRTCSEPDLASLFRTIAPDAGEDGEADSVKLATIRRHHSLDLEAMNDEDEADRDSDIFDQVREQMGVQDDDEFAEEEISLPQDNEEDEDGDDEIDEDDDAEDDDDDMLSMRETMQSLLVESDEEGEGAKKKINFRLSSDSVDGQTGSHTLKSSGKKQFLVGDGGDGGKDDGEDDEENEAEREKEELAAILDLDDEDESDDETVFGDDGGDDRFGRLEESRAELESELGIEKLLTVYQAIQEIQEEEDGNMEEGTKVAMRMLGKDKEHLFPKIFQLVMSDTAFTEDNE